MTWKMRVGGFLNKKDHSLDMINMRTSRYDNPTHIHEVNHDIVCIKENFGINPKMFRSDAPRAPRAPHALDVFNTIKF